MGKSGRAFRHLTWGHWEPSYPRPWDKSPSRLLTSTPLPSGRTDSGPPGLVGFPRVSFALEPWVLRWTMSFSWYRGEGTGTLQVWPLIILGPQASGAPPCPTWTSGLVFCTTRNYQLGAARESSNDRQRLQAPERHERTLVQDLGVLQLEIVFKALSEMTLFLSPCKKHTFFPLL